tara:strand:+ start:72 stop:209 length:138 start_codon:yes stop_codon:yes gene_type:complete
MPKSLTYKQMMRKATKPRENKKTKEKKRKEALMTQSAAPVKVRSI